jgi:hypothetical protein
MWRVRVRQLSSGVWVDGDINNPDKGSRSWSVEVRREWLPG